MRNPFALIIFLCVAVTAAGACAQDFIKGPWVQNVTTGGITVMWEADEQEATTPTVDHGETTAYAGGSVTATHASVNGYHVYSAAVTGLSSDTIYHYRVSSGSTQSADATFKTAPAAGSAGFRFYVIGDNRTYPATWGALTGMIRADMDEYPAHHQTFILNAGDIVTDGRSYADWDEWVPPAQSLLKSLPIYVGLGNHEDRGTSAADAFIYGYHDFPYAASGSTDEKWSSFDYGNVHVASVAIYDNSGYTSGPQYDWVAGDLDGADNDAGTDWSFILMHLLPWSFGPHAESEGADLRTYLHPIFRDENVVCGFGGHNHLYARYEPVDGVSYITSGGGGAELNTGSYTPWSGATLATSAQVHQFCVVDVEADAVSVRAIDLDGNRIDYVTFGGTALNRPPFADAGANASGAVGAPVSLSAAASDDPEGGGLNYEWTQVGGLNVTLSGAATAAPSFTTAIGGDYVFKLRVNDGTHWSAPDFCVATVSHGTATFYPEADTYIDDLNPDTNYGSDTVLLLDTDSHEYHTYLRFNAVGIGRVLSATLSLYCIDVGDTSQIVACSDTGWAEGAPTWNAPLDESGAVIGSLAAPVQPAWAEADVTDGVSGGGRVTFVLLPGGSGGADFHSRENTNVPELEVTYTVDLEDQDSDSDGLSDYDEIYWDGDAGYDPYHPVTNPTGTDPDTSNGDTDGDGQSDVIEARCGGAPLDSGVTAGLIRVNFQPAGSAEPSGFAGGATDGYSAVRGYGWQ